MHGLQSLPWSEPLDVAAAIDNSEGNWVLLYSGIKTSYSGRYSYLAHNLKERVTGHDFSALSGKLTNDHSRFDNAWFGYLGYGLKDSLEILTPDKPNWLSLPHLTMMRFNTIIRFDHDKRRIDIWSEDKDYALPKYGKKSATSLPAVTSFTSNMTRESYLEKVSHIIERIHAGDLYQANLTRKFTGTFSEPPSPLALFSKLCAVSPAPYSAFLRLGDTCILSSSPELFLHIDEHGHIRTRPIKGTAPRSTDPALDLLSLKTLADSTKDRAENLMIVDLMRNDLSRSCLPGSVTTSNLFEVTSHATVHHMSSTITGQLGPERGTLEAIAHCFPPGSMTGTPKITAMNLCSQLEELERGVYSGALGLLGGDGSCELSVIIRTLILHGQQFEFQVGGAIVADSIPEQELMETIDKSRGILTALGLSPKISIF